MRFAASHADEPSQGDTSTDHYTATERSATTDLSQYEPSTAAYTSYGEGEDSAGERSPYEKTDDDGYSYSEEGEGESTYYEGEGEGGEEGGESDGDGSYSDGDNYSEYSEGARTRSWLEQQGAQVAAVGTLLKMQIDDLLDPNHGLLFTPREQARKQQC